MFRLPGVTKYPLRDVVFDILLTGGNGFIILEGLCCLLSYIVSQNSTGIQPPKSGLTE